MLWLFVFALTFCHVVAMENGIKVDVKPGRVSAKQIIPAKFESKIVMCPDGEEHCPDGMTCCLDQGRPYQYDCCPLPNAVCCSDHIHCCPEGYTCHVSAGTCTEGNHVIKMLLKKPAEKKNIMCPGGKEECPSGWTCCKLPSGIYGCCAYPHAVCCSDHLHCCPAGYTCDVSKGTCYLGNHVIKMLLKKSTQKKNIKCPGGGECPGVTTCCKLSSGKEGCCPFPNAVCCSDEVHCCPDGYICDISSGTCKSKGRRKVLTSKRIFY